MSLEITGLATCNRIVSIQVDLFVQIQPSFDSSNFPGRKGDCYESRLRCASYKRSDDLEGSVERLEITGLAMCNEHRFERWSWKLQGLRYATDIWRLRKAREIGMIAIRNRPLCFVWSGLFGRLKSIADRVVSITPFQPVTRLYFILAHLFVPGRLIYILLIAPREIYSLPLLLTQHRLLQRIAFPPAPPPPHIP